MLCFSQGCIPGNGPPLGWILKESNQKAITNMRRQKSRKKKNKGKKCVFIISFMCGSLCLLYFDLKASISIKGQHFAGEFIHI